MFSKVFETLFGSKEVRILILGLDNAGKTTILYRLQNESDEAVQTIPTIGFNVETLQYKNIKVRKSIADCLKSLLLFCVSALCKMVVLTDFSFASQSQNLTDSSKYGISEDRPVSVPIGDATIPTLTPSFLWSTVPIRSECRSQRGNWPPCLKRTS